MLPMMGGMLLTSIVSGQLISRTGRYKLFPVAGTAVMTVGLFLLSRMSAGTSTAAALLIVLLLGLGMGMVMQVLVIAVQNAVDYADLGVATSGSLLFRLIGGAVGTAVLGAIFASRLAVNVQRLVPASVAAPTGTGGLDPRALARLPESVRALYGEAFTRSLGTVFLVGTAIAVLGFLLTWLLPERPLRETVAAASGSDVGGEVGDTFVMPRGSESLPQLLRGLAVVADRDVQRRHIEEIVKRAGLDLSAAAAWLLMRIDRDGGVDLASLAASYRLDATRLTAGLEELRGRGLIVERNDDGRLSRSLTPAGCEALGRVVDARRTRLGELFAEWKPEHRDAIEELIGRLGRELVPDAPTAPGERPAPSAR
jgi:MFS family permease